jgi:site-specific DNA recombinase
MRVGDYSRISYGDLENDGLGIARQQQDNASLIRLRGWSLANRYVDQDVSAYQPGVERPAFEQMLRDLTAGTIQGIVVWDLDRLCRKPSDLERVISIYERFPELVFATVQGDLQLGTSDGRTLARVMVAFANKSSSDTARRVAREKLQRAMAGDSTSNYRPFGWNTDGTLNKKEAQLIRECVASIFSGIGLPTVAARWNRQGIPTVRGKEWHSYTLRRVLGAPRMAGFVVYRGEVLRDEANKPIKGNWTPMMEEAEWQALQLVINPRAGIPRTRAKRYMMSGIARCGLCGMRMVGGTPPGKPYRYMCQSPDSGGCAKVSINGPKLDEQIEKLVLGYTKGRVVEAPEAVWEGQERLEQVGRQIAELMDNYRSGGLSGALAFPAIKALEDEQSALQAQRGKQVRAQKKATPIKGEWPDWDLDDRRAFITSILEAVIINPAVKRGLPYDPARVVPVWC